MKFKKPNSSILRVGTADHGKQLEITIEMEEENKTVATILAENDESQWFEIYENGTAFRIPLSRIKEAIEIAKNEVKSESWYEKNVYPKDNQT